MAGIMDIDQNKILETALKKVKEQAFYMKHAMVRTFGAVDLTEGLMGAID